MKKLTCVVCFVFEMSIHSSFHKKSQMHRQMYSNVSKFDHLLDIFFSKPLATKDLLRCVKTTYCRGFYLGSCRWFW